MPMKLRLSEYDLGQCPECRRILRTPHLGEKGRCVDTTDCVLARQLAWMHRTGFEPSRREVAWMERHAEQEDEE